MTSAGYPAPGEAIAHFRVGRRVGGGGMGVVFEALDSRLNRQVALKVISPHLADDPEFRARFTREAQAQASLDSPHVVHVYAHGEDEGRLYIASQLIPDGDLGAMIQAYGAPPLRTAVDILAQVADGLTDAHAAGLIHRDIKPANVLLRRRGGSFTAYLADFGIARQVDADHTHTASTNTVGTPTYMAPELHTGSQAGVTSDVYSLGCLLWATLTGRAPYSGTSDFQIITAHLEEPIPQLDPTSAMTVEVNRVLRSAMDKDPGRRYATASAMRDDLRRALTLPNSPVPTLDPIAAADPPLVATSATPPPGRGRLALVLVAAVVLVAGGLGLSYALSRDDPVARGPEVVASPSPSPSLNASAGESANASANPSVDATATPSASPSAGASAGDFVAQPGDEEKAAASFAEGLTGQGLTAEQSSCVATSVVTSVGLPTLVADGMFDEQLVFLNPDLAELPEIKSALTTASVSCLI